MTDEHGVAVQCDDVWFWYKKSDWVLKGISLSVPAGTFLSVLGKSGAGKTTLLKVLAGLLRARRGSVELLGHDLANGTPAGLRRRVGYIPQQLGLVRNLSAQDNVLMGALGRRRGPASLLGLFPKEDLDEARWWLDRLSVGHKAGEPVYRLSGGERQRVAIARTMVQRPSIVFADEFVSDLDVPRAIEILALMRSITESQGITFVVNLHDLPLVQEFSDRALVLRDGLIFQQGEAERMSARELEEVLQ